MNVRLISPASPVPGANVSTQLQFVISVQITARVALLLHWVLAGAAQSPSTMAWVNILIFPIACRMNNLNELGFLTCKTNC